MAKLNIDLAEIVDKQLDPDAVHEPAPLAAFPTAASSPPDEGDSGTDAVPVPVPEGDDA